MRLACTHADSAKKMYEARSLVRKKISYASVSAGNTKVGHPYVGDKHYDVPHKFRVTQDKGLNANFVDNSQHVL